MSSPQDMLNLLGSVHKDSASPNDSQQAEISSSSPLLPPSEVQAPETGHEIACKPFQEDKGRILPVKSARFHSEPEPIDGVPGDEDLAPPEQVSRSRSTTKIWSVTGFSPSNCSRKSAWWNQLTQQR